MEQFIPFILIIGLMYVLLILPQQRRNKEHRELLASLQEGDEVLTSSGVYGFINALDDDVIWLEVSDGVELKVSKASVANKVKAPVVAADDVADDVADDGDD